MIHGALKSIMAWMNLERGIFCAASVWLLAMGLRYQAAPVVEEWGPQRTTAALPGEAFVRLDPPAPIRDYLAGDRGNPFSDIERQTAFVPSRFLVPRENRRPNRPRPPQPPAQPPVIVAPPPPPPEPRPPAQEAVTPKPYELPVQVIGRVQVGGRDGRTIFMVKEDGTYLAVREGEELPGLGVRVVSASKSVIIVENEQGVRFRLTDLMRQGAE